MRALLLYNPFATSVSPRVREVIAKAFASETKLEVAETKRRGHAMHLAAGAVHEGFDLVVCLGGDGTLNEVINGLAGSDVPLTPLPGGGTNVFARTLGLPRDAVEAAGVLLERIRDGAAPRRVNLGVVNGRRFAFCAGVGFDAAVVRNVEKRARLKRQIGDAFFVSTALRTFFFGTNRRRPLLTIRRADEEHRGLFVTVVCNSNPYTYLGARPFQLCPHADLDEGLDIMALRTMRTASTLRAVLRAFGRGGHVRMKSVLSLHDRPAFEVLAQRPVPLQVDGDFAGEAMRFEFAVEPRALSVLV